MVQAHGEARRDRRALQGGGPALAAVMGGQVTFSFIVASGSIRQAGGKLVALAVTGPRAPRSRPACRPSPNPATRSS
jgi:tripartite-type tricarboxylate transporter receptor subunit TctC